jgi:hypothetical protein
MAATPSAAPPCVCHQLAKTKHPEADVFLMRASDRLRAALGNDDPMLETILGKAPRDAATLQDPKRLVANE